MARLPRQAPAALALAAGLATSVLAYSVLSARPAPAAPTREPMVVARAAIDETRPLAAADLEVVSVGRRPPGAFARPDEVVGRLPLVAVPAGQPLLSSHLATPGAQPDLWRRVPSGKRALALKLDEVTGVGGFIKPGMRVDLIGVAREADRWSSDLVAQNVPVLAVAQDDQQLRDETKAKLASSATLLVTPAQAEAISLAAERGAVRLVLRGPRDNGLAPRRVVATVAPPPRPAPVVRSVSRAAPRPVVVAQPKPSTGVEIIRGFNPEEMRP
jgi:pilus assembly protein CpaB